MGHPEVKNSTPFVFEPLHLADEELRPLVVPIVKGTFDIDSSGLCTPSDTQLPLNLTGELFGDDPALCSYKYEPEVAFTKPATDIVVVGNAYAPRPGTRTMEVAVRVGSITKRIRVFGDRIWFKTFGIATISESLPFETMPLRFERAYGGWDRSHPDPKKHRSFAQNPIGMGYTSTGYREGLRLPNLESPEEPIGSLRDQPVPAAFGFTGPHWEPRATLAGTYDEAWHKQRAPLLATNFRRSHFNAASSGMVSEGYLQGDESVVALGLTPEGRFECRLPGLAPPTVLLQLSNSVSTELTLALDTVILEPEARKLQLIWRSHQPCPNGPHGLERASARQILKLPNRRTGAPYS